MNEKERIKTISKINEEIAEKNGNRFFVSYISSYWYEGESKDEEYMKSQLLFCDFETDYNEYNYYCQFDFKHQSIIRSDIYNFVKTSGGRVTND